MMYAYIAYLLPFLSALSLTFMLRFFMFLVLCNTPVLAQKNTIDLESTFKGNQEQPKVLYIVPWQKINAPEAYYQPLESLIDENFELLDRDEFKRELKFKRQLSRQMNSHSAQQVTE